MAILESQGALYAAPFSKARDDQLREQLEDAFEALIGFGIVSGGRIVDNGGASVYLESGTIFFYNGVLYTLGSNVVYNGSADANLNTIWGRLVKTAASQSGDASRLLLSTYAVSLTSNTTDIAPGADYKRMAFVRVESMDITGINNAPPGKTVRLTDPLRSGKNTVAATGASVIESDEAQVILGPATIGGAWGVYGKAIVI